MTSDGISKSDWDPIHELAADLVNATLAGDPFLMETHHKQLFDALDLLELKYGSLPSLLATKGDFCDEPLEAIGYLESAYAVAVQIRDEKNQLMISESLAQRYFESHRLQECVRFIGICKGLLEKYPDEHLASEIEALEEQIRQSK